MVNQVTRRSPYYFYYRISMKSITVHIFSIVSTIASIHIVDTIFPVNKAKAGPLI